VCELMQEEGGDGERMNELNWGKEGADRKTTWGRGQLLSLVKSGVVLEVVVYM
jgi:hypothetical protein